MAPDTKHFMVLGALLTFALITGLVVGEFLLVVTGIAQ